MDDRRDARRYERQHDPTRVLALSDGVFAIVITLLVLEIHVPDLLQGKKLQVALEDMRPSLIGFLISFVVVAIAWAVHRDLFGLIRRTDRGLVWLNILYIFPVCLLPFGAALISRYEHEPVALNLYGFVLILIAATRLFLWLYATNRPHLLFEPVEGRTKLVGVLLVVAPAALYVPAILVSKAAPTLSLAIYAATPILYLAGVFLGRSTLPPGEADAFT